MLGHDYTGVKGLGKTTTQVKCSYFFIAGVYDVSVTINDVGIHPLVKVVCQVFPTLKLFFFTLPYSVLWKQITKFNLHSVELEVKRTGPRSQNGIIYVYYLSISVISVCAQSLSRVWLFATPWTAASQAPLSTGFCRREHWSRSPWLPLGDLPDPGTEPTSLVCRTVGQVLYHQRPGKPSVTRNFLIFIYSIIYVH